MHSEIMKLWEDTQYDEPDDMDLYRDYTPRKMTKKEFIKEMLRLQQERDLYRD